MESTGPASFAEIYASAVRHAGSKAALERVLPQVQTPRELERRPDRYYLSTMARRIFRAGLKHAMVDAKWPAFEKVFHGFDPTAVMYMSDEDLERLMGDARLIRHWNKLNAVRDNARAVVTVAAEHGSFGRYLAVWPDTRTTELWLDLRKRCRQLGGQSAAYFLRMAGKDTFLTTRDVLRALHGWGVDAGAGRRREELGRIQAAFNGWRAESRRPHAAVSMILARSLPP